MGLDARTQKLALTIFRSIQEIKGREITALDLSEVESYTDFILIASGGSERQLTAIADTILKNVYEALHLSPLGVEGKGSSEWVLIDFGSVVVHLFFEETRQFYHLEDMWINVKALTESKIEALLSGTAQKSSVKKSVSSKKTKTTSSKKSASPKAAKSAKPPVKKGKKTTTARKKK